MLARKFKIGSTPRIEHILKKGRYVKSRLFRLKYLRSRLSHSRFSLVISKRIGRKAVERNTVRRRVYEAIRRNWNHLPKTCYDVVVLLSQRITQVSYKDIEKDFVTILRKLY